MAPAAPSRRTPAAALAAAWLAAVAAVTAVERTSSALTPSSLAASPERIAHGELWTLLSSSLLVDGPPVGQVVVTALMTAWVISLLGGRGFWAVAAAGHLGSTLVAYAGIGLLWLVVGTRMEEVTDAPDYGISAVWAALAGAAAVAEWRRERGRRRRIAGFAGLVVLALFALLVPLGGKLADVEHLLAFLAGAVVASRLAPNRNASLSRAQGRPPTVAPDGPARPHPHEAASPSRTP